MNRNWAEENGISAIYLHGSRIEGDPGPQSDLDVAVLLETVPDDWQVLEDLRGDPELRLAGDLGVEPSELDVVFLHQAPPAFCYRAIRPGRILWEADSHFRVNFETRLMQEYLDSQYYEDIHNQAMRRRVLEGTFGYRSPVRQ